MRKNKGATAVIVAIVLIILLGVAALAVDIGYLFAARNELQNAADGAALAATRQLGMIYNGLDPDQQTGYNCGATDQAAIRNTAVDVGSKNKAATQFITINTGDIEIGRWDPDGSPRFVPGYTEPNAVRVTTRRDPSSAEGPVSTFFARILGINEVNVGAVATAALTAQSTSEPGELELPVGISKYRMEADYCNHPIRFNPTGDLDGCAGWHVFTEPSANANTLSTTIIQGILDGTYESPGTVAGETELEFIGGNVVPALDALSDLLEARSEVLGPMYFMQTAEDPVGNIGEYDDITGQWRFYDDTDVANGAELVTLNDGTTPIQRREWETGVVIYDLGDCSNPNQSMTIVGYATVRLWCVLDTQVKPTAAQQLIVGEIVCSGYYDGRGGGSDYGTVGTIPGLVE